MAMGNRVLIPAQRPGPPVPVRFGFPRGFGKYAFRTGLAIAIAFYAYKIWTYEGPMAARSDPYAHMIASGTSPFIEKGVPVAKVIARFGDRVVAQARTGEESVTFMFERGSEGAGSLYPYARPEKGDPTLSVIWKGDSRITLVGPEPTDGFREGDYLSSVMVNIRRAEAGNDTILLVPERVRGPGVSETVSSTIRKLAPWNLYKSLMDWVHRNILTRNGPLQ